MINTQKPIGIYIHIPYCQSKCSYCDFYSISDTESLDKYVSALCRHISRMSKVRSRTVDTIYIGGGTPSLLSVEQLGKICDCLYNSFTISSNCEFTMEANPASFNKDKIDAAKQFGINRISLGLQSSNKEELALLSRRHNYESFIKSYDIVRSSGFDNVNVDLMYGIPSQTIQSLVNSLGNIIYIKPEHISFYGLKIEENTVFGKFKEKYDFPDDDTQSEMYERAVDILLQGGYNRYEISNFAVHGKECRHNMKYWDYGEFLGFGPTAYSFIDGVRYGYSRSIKEYIHAVDNNLEPSFADVCKISEKDEYNEKIMLGLRLEKGIKPDDITLTKAEKYLKNGFMQYSEGRLKFTTKGILVSNTILSQLIDF